MNDTVDEKIEIAAESDSESSEIHTIATAKQSCVCTGI